jgi:fumarate reductase subunit D
MSESFFDNESREKPTGKIPPLTENSGVEGDGHEDEGFTSEEGRLAAIMAYIPFLCFIPLINMKENKEARFHARQGVMLFLVELLAALLLIDQISDFVFTAILLGAAAFSVAGIVFALQGKNYRLPIISDLADKSNL